MAHVEARLAELKRHAVRLFAGGQALPALRLHDAVVAAAPHDFEARLRVADCLVALGHAPAAVPVYRAVGWYALSAGHPLVAVVIARVLETMGAPADDLAAALVVRYGSESELIGKPAARIALPPGDTPVPPPDLQAPPPDDLVARAAWRAEHCLDGFSDYPELLHPVPLLSELSEDAFRRVLGTLVVRRLPGGAHVLREGEAGESFFFVATGAVRVYATDGLGRQQELATLGENAVFGEMALLSAQPRTASVEVVGEADLLEVTRASLAQLADELQPVAEALHRFTRDRLLANLLATSPLFRPFSRAQQLDLLRRFTSHDVAPGTAIIHEHEEGHGLFVVLSGELEVTTVSGGAQVPLATLRAGEVFGEGALLSGGRTSASVTATRPSTVLFLARTYVERMVAGVPEIKQYLGGLAEERAIDNSLALADADSADGGDARILI
jgi:cAMP-dependent protein kinase regulator